MQPECSMYSLERQVGEILRGHKNTFSEKCSKWHAAWYIDRFLDLNQLLGRVKRSNLVQSDRNTSLDVLEGLEPVCVHNVTHKFKKLAVKTLSLTHFDTFSAINELLGRVKRSNLVQSDRNTSLGVLEGLKPVSVYNITQNFPQKN